MFCKFCGKKLPDDAVFCGGCGKHLSTVPVEDLSDKDTTLRMPYMQRHAQHHTAEQTDSPAKPTPAEGPAPYKPVQDIPHAPATPYTPPRTAPYTPPKTESTAPQTANKALTIAIIVTAAVFVTCLVILAIVYLLPSRDYTPSGGSAVQNTVAVEATEPAETQPVNPLSESNPYRAFFTDAPYLLADSSERYYVRSELSRMSATELSLARNEILARRGYTFRDEDLLEYFTNKSWYSQKTGSYDSVYAQLNEHEQANVALFLYCQDLKEGNQTTPGSHNSYLQYYDADSQYILPQSDRIELTVQDLKDLDRDALCLARNEIHARHGYRFETDVMVYFSYCTWYTPGSSADNNSIRLSDVETKNVYFIRKYENALLEFDDLDRRMNYTASCNAFRVNLPNYWKSCADIETENNGIRFYEKISHWDNAGHVFSLFIIRPDEMYSFWGGMSQKVGTLISPQGETYYLVCTGPTDVQYDPTHPYVVDIYQMMSGEKVKIQNSISGINGWQYIPN